MTILQFDQFVRQSQAAKASMAVDWVARREEWLAYLHQLYQWIEVSLEPYTTTGQIRITYTDVEITEDQIGTYTARAATVFIGDYQVRLQPVGTNLIAAQGRVDMVGAYGKVKLVLVPVAATAPEKLVTIGIPGGEPPHLENDWRDDASSLTWEWKIATAPPRIRYLPLAQESFLDALMEVANANAEMA